MLSGPLRFVVLMCVTGLVGTSVPAPEAVAQGGPQAQCSAIAWRGVLNGVHEIFVASPDGTNRTVLSSVDAGDDPDQNRTPTWSPDGTQIAWAGGAGIFSEIYVASADGLDRVAISSPGSHVEPTWNQRPAWSPDGSQLAWIGTASSVQHVFVSAPDGTNRVAVSAVGPDPDPTYNQAQVWSPDGSRIAWIGSNGPTTHVYVSNADGSGRIIVSAVEASFPTDNHSVRWSPDGAKLAWLGNTGAYDQLYVADPDGTNRVVASDTSPGRDPTHNSEPTWSPDGKAIAWIGHDGFFRRLYIAAADGTSRVSIPASGPDPEVAADDTIDGPAWSPDGNEIAWAARPDGETFRFRVYVSSPDGSGLRAISDSLGYWPWSATWSTDGATLAWVENRGETGPSSDWEIVTAAADGSYSIDVTSVGRGPHPIGNAFPAWAPAGTWLADLDVAVTNSGDFAAGPVAVEVTVTNASECDADAVAVTGLASACIASPDLVVDSGVAVGSTWSIGTLAPGATARATLTGMGDGTGSSPCTSSITVEADQPRPGGPTTRTVGKNICPTGPAPFNDVPPESFAFHEVACLFGLDLTTGTSAITYSPADFVTREQMAAFLARLWREVGRVCPDPLVPFTDVGSASFAFADIGCIYGLGVTTGTSATTYSPADFVTREQMAAFLARIWRAFEHTCPSDSGPFVDVPLESFAFDDIGCIYGLGVTTGTSPTTYSPADFVTREQMAAFLARLWRIAPFL